MDTLPPEAPPTAAATLVPRRQGAGAARITARWAWGLAAVSVVLVAAAAWTYAAVSDSLRESRAAGLSTLLNTQATALKVWVEEKKRFAERWAGNAEVGALVGRLLRAGEGSCAAAEIEGLSRLLQPFFKTEESVAFHVITPTGRIAASYHGGRCGRQLADEAVFARIAPVFGGATRFVRPYAGAEALPRATAAGGGGRPLIWIEAPVRGTDGKVIAALGFGKHADEQFSRILGVSRPGETGEAYAFDEQPVMLSSSRFRDSLQSRGEGAGEALRQAVREPGGEAPPTRLAAAALAARNAPGKGAGQGVLLAPYVNYRGARVVGAWTWLPEYDFGLALELDADEAYEPLRVVAGAFGGLAAAMVVFALLFAGSSLWLVRMRLTEAKRVGRYALLRQIGEGGISRVYLARHEHLTRPAAVKVLKMHLATDELVARFEREAELCSRLTHPNTIEIFDYGRTRSGVSYYAMEYLSGATLAEIVAATGPMPLARVLHVLRHTCGSLGEAHAMGLVHRDIKPENIMLCTKGGAFDVVKVVDFGLVKEVARPTVGVPGRKAAVARPDLTIHSRVLGTPLYMAPERLRNPADADARADIYALGALAYYLLAGHAVFGQAGAERIVEEVLNMPAPRLDVPGVPEAFADLVAQCLDKDRERRPERIEEVVSVIDVIGYGLTWRDVDARRWWEQHPGLARERPGVGTGH